MTEQSEVFHSSISDRIRKAVHVVLVRPEISQNVGAVARAISNMGINGSLCIVGRPSILDEPCRKLAKHAFGRLQSAIFCENLQHALAILGRDPGSLVLASTARIGSAHRPHPLGVAAAVEKAIGRLASGLASRVICVFGPESDGLNNEEILQCDWVVTIPSSDEYRSLNLAQAVLIFAYEVQKNLLGQSTPGLYAPQNERLALSNHLIKLAIEAGFVLPGDPFKMRPKLQEIVDRLNVDSGDVNILHGLFSQISRNLNAGRVSYKGRYKQKVIQSDKLCDKSIGSSQ